MSTRFLIHLIYLDKFPAACLRLLVLASAPTAFYLELIVMVTLRKELIFN